MSNLIETLGTSDHEISQGEDPKHIYRRGGDILNRISLKTPSATIYHFIGCRK